jgi:hypothetical protein
MSLGNTQSRDKNKNNFIHRKFQNQARRATIATIKVTATFINFKFTGKLRVKLQTRLDHVIALANVVESDNTDARFWLQYTIQ